MSRERVLGDEWGDNLQEMYPGDQRPDLVCFTGDVADWGLKAEYVKAQQFFDNLVSILKIDHQQIYVVPGNHDVYRPTSKTQWQKLREAMSTQQGARAVSDWLAGGPAPSGLKDADRNAVLKRTSNFWKWVEGDLKRPELLPRKANHPRLGYVVEPRLERLDLLLKVSVIGLDSAWLAGEGNDSGQLWLTQHQREMLLYKGGKPRQGFRLVLMHHPLSDLADAEPSKRDLAKCADLLLHGHQHDPVGTCEVDLDGRTTRVLAAGCLYEGEEGAAWPNSCQRIDIVLNDDGRPQRAEIRFRAWSSRGHWHSDSSLYKSQAPDGSMTWHAWANTTSSGARSRAPRRSPAGHLDDSDASPADKLIAAFARVPAAHGCLGGAGVGVDHADLTSQILDDDTILGLTMRFVRAMERAEGARDLDAAECLMELFKLAAPVAARRCAALTDHEDGYQTFHWQFPEAVEPSVAAACDRSLAFLANGKGGCCIPRYYIETQDTPKAHIDQGDVTKMIECDIMLRDETALGKLAAKMEKHLGMSPDSDSLEDRFDAVDARLLCGPDRAPRYTVIKDVEKPGVRALMEALKEVSLLQIVATRPTDRALRKQGYKLRDAITTLHGIYYRIMEEHES